MLHPYGVCSLQRDRKGYLDMHSLKNHKQAPLPNISYAILIQHFGDFSNDCYYPHKDLLIPPR